MWNIWTASSLQRSSTARIRERLADGDVIVVEVIRGPLLDRGFLGVWFISLRDVVVVGFNL